MVDVKQGRELLAKATAGRWDVYVEETPLPSDVYRELEEQARHNVDDKSFTGKLVMLTDGKRAPAITGCGPASHDNAEWIVWAHNNAEALLSAAERADAANARADAAEKALQRIVEIGNVYYATTLTMDCVKVARDALAAAKAKP